MDGLIISNHGGRQCDYVPAAVDMLPQIVEVVNRKVLSSALFGFEEDAMLLLFALPPSCLSSLKSPSILQSLSYRVRCTGLEQD